ncbi:MAG: GNAT family N-acetyltransferase [Bacteroidota bacterium]
MTIRTVLRPGDIGFLTYLHGILYAKEYGWDHTFEAYVGEPLSQFAKSHSRRDRIWVVQQNNTIVGSIAIVTASRTTAQLRWFLLHPSVRGLGVGKALVTKALNFCRKQGCRRVFLWTEARLTSAAGLYASFGFKLTEEKTHKLWGTVVTEQRYDLKLR